MEHAVTRSIRFPALGAVLLCLLALATPAHADRIRRDQWHLEALDIARAHELAPQLGEGVKIGIMDTGVDGNHPDLRGNVRPGMDLYGRDPKGWTDLVGHGTGMAGLAVGHGHGPGDGAIGIAPRAKVIPVRIGTRGDPTAQILGSEKATRSKEWARAVSWLVRKGARIISISYDAPTDDTFQNAVKAAKAKGVLLINSAGNSSNQQWTTNGSINMHFTVGASNKAGKLDPITVEPGPFSPITILAPGRDIVSTGRDGGYRIGTGTSPSSPIVAGTAALIWSRYPELRADEVAWRITSTAKDVGAQGNDPKSGWGVIDPVAALNPDLAPTAVPGAPTGTAPAGTRPPCPMPWQTPPRCAEPPPTGPAVDAVAAAEAGDGDRLPPAAIGGIAVLVLVTVSVVAVLAVRRRGRVGGTGPAARG